jgi:proteasome accessory factor A
MLDPQPILNRLIGLETEYSIRFLPDPAHNRPIDRRLFEAIVVELRRQLPLLPAQNLKRGVFLATGGAVWFEKAPYRSVAHIEGATPECRGPRCLLACQRAQDRLLSVAAASARVPGELTLCKGNADAAGHVYGAQENYEVHAGPRLRLWQLGRVFLLIPVVVVTFLLVLQVSAFAWAWALAALLVLLPGGLIAHACEIFGAPRAARALRRALLGRESWPYFSVANQNAFFPPAISRGFILAEQLAVLPLALAVGILARLTLHRKVRRALLPFLITRGIFCGAGRVDSAGRFHLAGKAHAINRVIGVGVFGRPIFNLGHLAKGALLGWSFPGGAGMGGPTLRLQIGLGDSNLCDEAEYLRVATTSLVLDAIEVGAFDDFPSVRRPIDALARISADPTLRATVQLADGSARTALAVQREYLRRCSAFVNGLGNVCVDEAHDILRRWEEVLTLLEANQNQLVGRIDWITKRYLLEQCAPADAPADVRQKIDLRYHELSPDGYFDRLRQADLPAKLLTESEITVAQTQPPPGTPATRRGRYVTAFAGDPHARANWHAVTSGPSPKRRVHSLV